MKLYRHYKNKPYKYLGVARHSETLDEVVLYETLYQNDLGKLWVRPRKMFEEDIELSGKMQARFARIPLELKLSEGLTHQDWSQIQKLAPELKSTEQDKPMLIQAFVDQKNVGFILGFSGLADGVFSICAVRVAPEFRNLGIATDLIAKLLMHCRERSYKSLEFEISYKAKDLVMFCLKNEFKIQGSRDEKLLVLNRSSLPKICV